MIVNDRNYIWDIKRGDSANKNENQKVYYWLVDAKTIEGFLHPPVRQHAGKINEGCPYSGCGWSRGQILN